MHLTQSLTASTAALVLAGTLIGAVPAEAAPRAGSTVTIVAKSDGAATVTSSGNGVIQQKERSGTWTRTFKRKSFTYYSVTVTAFGDGATKVACKIKVNGKTIRNKSASGDFASVACSYTTH